MDKTARWVGYGSAFAILASVLWLIITLRGEFSSPQRQICIHFPETGALRMEDPVARQGVVIGRVHSVAADTAGALVCVELFDRKPLHADARFVNFNHSLMGDRMVVLVPGTSDENLDERRIQVGFFANGVAETIHQVDGLLRMVFHFDSLSSVWRKPSDSAGSWSGVLNHRIFPAFDEITRLGKTLEKASNRLNPDLAGLERTTAGIASLAHAVHGKADTAIHLTAKTMVDLDSLSRTGEALVSQVDSLLQLLAGPQASLRPLLLERDVYDRTLQLSETLRLALSLLTHDGLDIIHGKNLHFFGPDSSDASGMKP